MAFSAYYTDPKKKKLQIVEIVAIVALIVIIAIIVPPILEEHRNFKTAVAFHEMGHEHLHNDDNDAALECFQAAVRTYPMESSFLEIASIHHFKGDHEKEIEVYRDGLKAIKDSTKLRYSLAAEYYLQEKYDEAIAELEIALNIDPNDADAQNLLKHCQMYKEHPEKRGRHQLSHEDLNKRFNNHDHDDHSSHSH